MKLIRVSVTALFLLLIGVSIEPGVRFRQQSVAFFVPGRIAAVGIESRLPEDSGRIMPEGGLAEGSRLLNEKCSVCHSVNFVLNSGMLAGEVDSTVSRMIRKGREKLDPDEQTLIKLFLETRLPLN